MHPHGSEEMVQVLMVDVTWHGVVTVHAPLLDFSSLSLLLASCARPGEVVDGANLLAAVCFEPLHYPESWSQQYLPGASKAARYCLKDAKGLRPSAPRPQLAQGR